MLPIEVYQYIALNFGLLILAAWFYILLLILREFRKFAGIFMSGKGVNTSDSEEVMALCKDSVDRASQFNIQHEQTISELLQVQTNLESQLAHIRASTADHITKEEQSSINELNKKLSRSHKLIRRLKGDLDISGKKLKYAKSKLEDQFQSVGTLQEENSSLQREIEQLKVEIQTVHQSAVPSNEQEIHAIVKQYERQIEEQNQLIEQLSVEQPEHDGEALQQELHQAKQKIKHLAKENKFIESRYLEAVKQADADKARIQKQ
ncbi:hypothetical protein N474_22590 [Pseudoalteromonas luteoviolacea CPMOR-2]|uniref:Chromosome partitioning protein ParA n=2 Tax=Pseudoalteromonas luteoviolacea TaxID=43657 RepID=A0A161XUH0_9GAMM|nr:hypothetical protein N475_19360 [Pseudoalteromonas luteoviolacea DSM 6061]KZN52761.1 hypothetical protein N474_22590 [Pseudoalteromonas luteoviolacea CPMOR-2]MBE0389711.1 hypothetical protein [Pseudoalteromonas luteoviolacea DSM 6061]TQF68160.1 chromosome partitioning protein ParA [Pseudoalteromonas luteoviolacea]